MLLLVWAFPSAADEQSIQSVESIREAAQAFLEQEASSEQGRIEIEVGQLDPRLRLQRCELPLSVAFPPAGRRSGNLTVGVRCDGDKPWTIYVQAKVKVMLPVVVSTGPISRGSRVSSSDLTLEERDVGSIVGGYLTDIEEAVGLQMRRSVRPGMVLEKNMLKAEKVVKRGEMVTILAETSGIEVRMEGKALEDGTRGEVIRVENLSSGKQIEAQVIAAGLVKVRL